jgi:hypothetical protein
MDKSIKKTVRKKAYKSMSVSELVAARKELLIKMEEIDSILVKAVEAINGVKQISNRNYPTNSDPAFMPAYNSLTQQNQVAVSTEAPIMAPVNRTAPDQSSGFSIFDAESFAQQQAKAEEEYLASNPSTVVENVDFDFDNFAVKKEIENLKEGIENSMKDVQNS